MAPFDRNLDKIGICGSLFTALCCLGFPALLSVLSAVGLGFLMNDMILFPLLVGFLALTFYGLYRGYQEHGRPRAVVLGGTSAVALLVFLFVFFSRPLAYLSLAGLVGATLLNARFLMQRA